MGTGHRLRVATATLALAVASAGAASASAAPPSPAAGEIATRTVDQSAAEVRDYWTRARMRAAIPAILGPEASFEPRRNTGTAPAKPSFVRPSGGRAPLRSGKISAARASDVSAGSDAFPNRVHGKVFLTLGGIDYVCSGTVVRSFSHALAWTAGHCVNGADIGLGFATNWMFVPGYHDGTRPYGTWTAAKLLTTEGWREHANVRFDVGTALLARDGQGRGIEDVVGGRGIAFNQPRNQTFDAFGYPASDLLPLIPPDFNGERLWACHSPRTADDSPSGGSGPQTMEINCDMTPGASGGGWVTGGGFVNSVTSYGYEFDYNHLYGPYLGDVAEALYRQASGPELVCGGREVTNLGTGASDDFEGGPGRDSFRLRGGADRAEGSAGADAICGGAGRDLLIGGPGRDICDGGPGRDRAIGCERRRRIP